jgi:uroporphyrinogen-III synthase
VTDATAPLAGRVVLVTRPGGRAGELIQALENLGARVEARPTIRFDSPRDPGSVERTCKTIDRFAWVVLTSATGVRALADALEAAGVPGLPPSIRVAAVGAATARVAEGQGWNVALVPRVQDGAGLAAELESMVDPEAVVLVVRPEVASDDLARALEGVGASVESVAFYRTVAAPGAASIVSDLATGRYDAVVFTSPSTLLRLLDADSVEEARAREALGRVARVAIGATTAAALDREGLAATAVASRPDPDGIAEAVRSALA